MTVPVQIPFNQYIANGVTTEFPFTFLATSETHLKVFLGTVQQTTGFTVTGVGDDSGGSVSFTSPPLSTDLVTIRRNIPLGRTLFDYQNSGDFSADVVDLDFDTIWQAIQQISSDFNDRVLKFPETVDLSSIDNTLPAPQDGRVLTWSNGSLINAAITDTSSQISFLNTIPKVDTKALALASMGLDDGQGLLIMGESAVGDGGGGAYVYDASSALVANGGTILALDTLPGRLIHAGITPVTAKMFGALGNGIANDTAAMLAFFTYCIVNEKEGYIGKGDYLIDRGVLVFDNNHVKKTWPHIKTAGNFAVTFKDASGVNAPFITISNGTAYSIAGQYWIGGELGGITFDQNGHSTAANQHGISLMGIWGCKFGWLRGEDLGGSTVYFPPKFYPDSLGNLTNPDPYAVTFCDFEAIEANRGVGYAIENRNFLGFNGCTIASLRVIECESGGWYGFGTGNVVGFASMGSVKGVAFDDGTDLTAVGGPPLRITIKQYELDDCQYGIKLNRTTQFDAPMGRIVHRYNYGPLNTDNKYWPLEAVSISGGAVPNTRFANINIIHRIEAGGSKADMGIFYNGNNHANVLADIEFLVQDNAGFGFDDSDLYTNVSLDSKTVVKRVGTVIKDVEVKVASLVRSATSVSVLNTGFGTIAGKLDFTTPVYDRGGYYDAVNSKFEVPYDGLYKVNASINLSIPVGTRVRMAFYHDAGGILQADLVNVDYQVNTGIQNYTLSGLIYLSQGVDVFLMADQNTGAPVALSTLFGASSDLTWSIHSI